MPSFAPEILRRVRLTDNMKAKKLKQALQELAEEGVVQVFRPHDGAPAIVGVVGPLQLDVLKVPARRRIQPAGRVRQPASSSWRAGSRRTIRRCSTSSSPPTAPASPTTSTATWSISPATQFYLGYTAERAPGIRFADVKDVKAAKRA